VLRSLRRFTIHLPLNQQAPRVTRTEGQMKNLKKSLSIFVALTIIFCGAADLWAGGKNKCYSKKKCKGKVLNSKIQHAHNCKGKSIEILDGSVGGKAKNGCYTVKKADQLQKKN